MAWMCLPLLLLWASFSNLSFFVFSLDRESISKQPSFHDEGISAQKGQRDLKVAGSTVRDGGSNVRWSELTQEMNSQNIHRDNGLYALRARRNLLQEDDGTSDEADFECGLTTTQVEAYLNNSTRTWLVDDKTLEDLDNDLQAVMNCAEDGDVVMFDVSQTIIPASRILISRRLTISSVVDNTELKDGVFPATPSRTTITCPDTDEGIFVIRSKSPLFANIFFSGCSFDNPGGIVEVQDCDNETVTDILRLHHVGFTDNQLIGGVGLLMNTPSCFATELIDVEFRDNECNGVCGATMSLENKLEDVVIEQNTKFGDADDTPAILFAPEGSVTTANNITARKNEGTIIFIHNGSLTLTDSSFREKSADVNAEHDLFGSVLHVINSTIDIKDCNFVENTADLGGVLYLEGSHVDVTGCRFEDNFADNGAVFYAKQGSRIKINASIFVNNSAMNNGGIVHADGSDVVVGDSTFDRNLANYSGGCFGFVDSGVLSLESSNFTGNEAVFGGVVNMYRGQCMMHECIFNKNRAMTSGGVIYMEQSTVMTAFCHAMEGNATFGGVFFSVESTLRIQHSRCERNNASYGGCIQTNRASIIEMDNVTVANNIASKTGGGIYMEMGSSLRAEGSNFTSNSAGSEGAAIGLESSQLFLKETQLKENSARNGSGIAANNDSAVSTVDVLFERNKGTFGAAIFLKYKGQGNISNCSFLHNEAEISAGSVYIQQSMANVEDCSFRNGISKLGGFVFSTESRMTIYNTDFIEGSSTSSGGCFHVRNGSLISMWNVSLTDCQSVDNGGAIDVVNCTMAVNNCTMSSNSATDGASVRSSGSNVTFEAVVFKNGKARNLGGVHSTKNSTLNMHNCHFFDNNAKNGGALNLDEGGVGNISHCSFIGNVAEVSGGAVYIESTYGTIDACEFEKNKADYGGSITTFKSTLEAHNLTIVDNSATVSGGGIHCKQSMSLILTESKIARNSATWGGGVHLSIVRRSILHRLMISQNSASKGGGGIYFSNAKTVIEELNGLKNEASIGGTLDIRNSSINITTSTCNDSSASMKGGAVYADNNSTLRIENVSIQSAKAGIGGAVFLQSAQMIAANLTASYCRSEQDGGVALVNAASTLLCINCSLKHSIAKGRGGAISIESNQTQLLAVQLQYTIVFNNSAEFGGGLHFVSPYQKIDCSVNGANCTYVALSNTQLEKNTASYAGGAIFTTDINTIKINCSEETYSDGHPTFYGREQWESMNVIRSEEDLCSGWKDNCADTYGDSIGSYGTRVETTIQEQAKTVVISNDRSLYVILNHASGTFLPVVRLKLVDAFGQGPAIGVKDDTVTAVMSSRNFLSGTISKELERGTGNFSKILGFQVPGIYDIVISFSEDSLEPVHFQVQIRSCGIGEKATSNNLFCEKCTAATYSFDPIGDAPCLPCPENADCTSVVIQPVKGYWNPFPCSEHVQRCLTKRACNYKDRDEVLTKFRRDKVMKDIQSCKFDDDVIDNYTSALCKQGHKGPLCGSCKENYGKSQSFDCKKCFTGFGNVVWVLLSITVLTGLSGFTTRSNLVSFVRQSQTQTATDGAPSSSSGSPIVHTELEMMERYYLGKTVGSQVKYSKVGRVNVHDRAARLVEMSKWKAVELFKIAVNFIQITAIAITVNVEWSALLVGLFETQEFIGGITSEAANRSMDCLIAENSSIPRSIISTIVDLLVPVGVVGLFVVFWTMVTFKKKESWTYLLKRSVLSVLAVFYISYISTTKTLVNILSCIKVHDSKTVMVDHTSDYWAVDTSLQCYEGSHAVLSGAVGWPLLVLFSLLFPITVAFVIVYNVRQNYEDGWIYDVAGFMYRSYRHKYIFWESIIMLRKAALAVVVVFAYPLESSMQAVLAVLVLAFSLYLQMICHPYRKEFDSLNEMEGLSLLVSLLTFVSSLCFDNDHVPLGGRVAITIAVFCCNICLILSFLVFFFIFGAEHLKAVLDREGVPYQAGGGTLHILRVYLFGHLISIILKKFRDCFKWLVVPGLYEPSLP